MVNSNTGDLDLEKLFYRILLIIRRFFILILICLAAGASLGYVYSNVSKKIYGSKMLISSYVLTQSYAKELVNNVNLFIQEGNVQLLQSRMNISAEVAENMVKISAEGGLDDVHLLEEKDRVFVRITAQMKDPSGFKDLEKGLIHYLETNEYTKKLSAQKRKGYEETIQLMDKQIKDMEQLREQLISGELSKKNGNLSVDVGMLGTAIVESAKAKSEAQENLVLKQGVQLVDGFTSFSEPQWPRKSTSIMLGIALGGFIAFFLIIAKLIRERLALGIDNL
jgi:hypothetical protein